MWRVKSTVARSLIEWSFAAIAVCVGPIVVRDMAQAVPQESQKEKEANLKQQAMGGLFKQWTFDQEPVATLPSGFTVLAPTGQPQATWTVQRDDAAPTRPNVVAVSAQCPDGCYHLLIATGLDYEYPDLSVRFRAPESGPAVGGVVFGAKDGGNFYAAVVDLRDPTVQVVRMVDGKESLLAQSPVKLKPVDWHSLRVQRNTIISKDFIETFVDGTLVLSVEDQTLGLGLVGLLTKGNSSLFFDSFHAVPLFSHRPLSAPAAY